jgi:hypothetical protein
MQHETKAVENPLGDIESTDTEKEKRSRAVRKAKVPFDPSSSPVSRIRSTTRRRIIIPTVSDSEEDIPSPPTPPSKRLGLANRSNDLLQDYDGEETNSFRSPPQTNKKRTVASTSKDHGSNLDWF